MPRMLVFRHRDDKNYTCLGANFNSHIQPFTHTLHMRLPRYQET